MMSTMAGPEKGMRAHHPRSLGEKTHIAANERIYTDGVICDPVSDDEPEQKVFSTGNEGAFED
jgi:hypothetical protein